MALTPSNMLPLGTTAPAFSLPDVVSGKLVTLDTLKSDKATVIIFMCNHCPFVQHILKQLVVIADNYRGKGISFIGINANDVDRYPDDAPEKMKDLAIESGFSFPYLFDGDQKTAKAYNAACTPDFYIFDKELKCVYRGQFDDSRPGNGRPVTGIDLTNALDCIIAGTPVQRNQKPSIGCNIKWK